MFKALLHMKKYQNIMKKGRFLEKLSGKSHFCCTKSEVGSPCVGSIIAPWIFSDTSWSDGWENRIHSSCNDLNLIFQCEFPIIRFFNIFKISAFFYKNSKSYDIKAPEGIISRQYVRYYIITNAPWSW